MKMLAKKFGIYCLNLKTAKVLKIIFSKIAADQECAAQLTRFHLVIYTSKIQSKIKFILWLAAV